MCKYVLFVVLTTLFISVIYIFTTLKSDVTDKKVMQHEIAKKKIKHHIPKIMLDLYENRKISDHLSRADVVRSLIPKMSGEFLI